MELTSTDVEAETSASAGHDTPDSAANPVTVRWLAVAAVAAAAAAGLWISAAALTAGHGFDTSDEGFYLLSYRWWSSNFRTLSGVQYLYGPVFQLLGYDIAALRVVRLLTVVGAHLVFGWTFMRWLRQRRPKAPASPLWETAGVAVIVACGGMVYCWLPLSPAYNDVALLGGLLAGSIMLWMAANADRGAPIPGWVPAALGPVIVAMLLAKWTSSALTLGLVAVVGTIVLAPRGPREVIRVTAWTAAGALVAVGLIHVLLVPLTTALPQMLTTSRLVAVRTNSPLGLLDMYLATTTDVLETVTTRHALLLLAAVFAVLARGPIGRRLAGLLAVAGLGVSAWRLVSDGALNGGTVNLKRFPVGVLLVLVAALVVAVSTLLHAWHTRSQASSLSREGKRGWAILAMLALLPVTQAAGTGNALYFMAVNGFAAWVAIVIAVLTGIETAPAAARWLTATMAGGAVVLSTSIATDGLWSHPYRTAAYHRTTAVVHGVPALDSVLLEPDTAQAYSQLHRVLQPYIEPEGRAMMAFDEMAGVVLFLDGRSVGEAWYSATDRARTAAGIRAECSGGQEWGSRAPILLFRRPVSEIEVDALRSCGLVFDTDYRLVAPKEETMGLLVYVPTAEAAKG